MPNKKNYREDLLFPELSYEIIGVLFEVSNTLRTGYLEKYYQKAIDLRKFSVEARLGYQLRAGCAGRGSYSAAGWRQLVEVCRLRSAEARLQQPLSASALANPCAEQLAQIDLSRAGLH